MLITTKLSGLGAVPAILVSAVLTMLKYGYSSEQAASAVAEQYEQFYKMSEKQITDLALELGRNTDTPYWDWFNILRTVQRLGPGAPDIPDQLPEPAKASVMTSTWFLVAGVLGLAFLALRR